MPRRTLRQPHFSPSAHIAVIRLWAIGESLLALPAIAALKAQWPESEITVITTPRVADVFRGHKFIDEILVIQPTFLHLRGVKRVLQHWKKFDVVIDFEPYLYASAFLARVVGRFSVGFDTLSRGKMYSRAVPYRDDQHVVETNLDLVQLLTGSVARFQPPQILSPYSGPGVSEFGRLRSRSTIALAPGGGVDFRRWPTERFAEVADYLIENYQVEVLLVGDQADVPVLKDVQKNMKNSVQIVSNQSIREVAELLSDCRLTIANDGGLMHLSASVGTPTLGLFGPETPVRMGPYGPSNRAIYHQLHGNPIINVSRGEVPGMLSVKGDWSRYVRAITVEEVIETAGEMLEESRSIPPIAVKTSATEMARIS